MHTVQRSLPFAARNVALYWQGHPNARVTVAFSRDGDHFGRPVDVGRDEMGAQRRDGRTYGGMLTTFDAVALRIRSSEPISTLFVLGIRDRIRNLVAPLLSPTPVGGGGSVARPPIVSRVDWGADESIRKGQPAFAPITKLIVHHTDTPNGDRNPAATIRAIYQYHVVAQGWDDIGYNFLIDEAGRIYKGRNSHAPGSSTDTINGQDAQGRGVIGAHALGHNKGTVGVALLGTLTSNDATPAAKRALESLLAWEADAHHIDPHGSSPYAASSGAHETFPNIAGHRDTGRSTQCPGDAFEKTLPEVRNDVAVRIAAA